MIKDRAINQAAFGFALMRDDRSNIHAIRCIRAIIKRIADEDRARDVRSVAYDVGKNLVQSLSHAPCPGWTAHASVTTCTKKAAPLLAGPL